jgi:hypothetical protein
MAMTKLGAVLLLSALAVYGCPSSGDSGASIGGSEEAEQVQAPNIKVNLPPSPSFQKEHAPERYTDQSYSVYGLRKNIKTTLNQQVRVKGYLLEVYECPPCPKGTTCKTCDKPHLWLADRANSPKEEAMMVAVLPKEDPKTKKKVGFDVGQQYFFTGTFAKQSATGFSHSEGLLMYQEGKKASE